MSKIDLHKTNIKEKISYIKNNSIFTTKYLRSEKLFISLYTGDYNDRIIYALIDKGILKVNREVNGTSENKPKIYFTGKDLKSALKKYYKL